MSTTRDSISLPDEVPLGFRQLVRDEIATVEYFSSGAGPVVVLLPPLAGHVLEFNPLVKALNAAGYRTLSIHQTGVGASRRRFRPRPTLKTFVDDVARVLEHAGVGGEERVFLLGRALGNRIARMFAASYPQRVQGLMLLAAGERVSSKGFGRQILRYLCLQLPGFPISWRRRLLEPLLCARHNVLPDFACRRPPLRAVAQQGGAARRTNRDLWSAGGGAPMLVLQGEQDLVAPPQYAQQLKAEYPERVELKIIPNAGHALTFDAPEEVEREVLRFLQRQTSAA